MVMTTNNTMSLIDHKLIRKYLIITDLNRTEQDIHDAVKLWCTNHVATERKYGSISNWDMKDMSTSYDSTRTVSLAPTTMRTFMNTSGGCFDGDSTVELSSGFVKRVKDLVKGDILSGNNKIVCIVKTKINGKVEMVKHNNMLITPWHPIRINKEWVFPINITCSMDYELDYIYNIVLDSGHTCLINYTEVVTLGHNFTDNNVVQHDYYGSDKVIQDLMTMDGWDVGLVIMEKQLVNRRGSDGRVVSMSAYL